MAKFLLGVVVGVILIPGFVFVYFSLGYAPVATWAAPMPFEKRFARMALHTRIAKDAPERVPLAATEHNLAAGARVYREHCALCHGLIGHDQTATAKGMFPHPPQLFKGKGVTDDSPGESYWKAANGIRLTGMPSYRGSLTEDQLWQVSLLLANADKLPESVKALMTQPR